MGPQMVWQLVLINSQLGYGFVHGMHTYGTLCISDCMLRHVLAAALQGSNYQLEDGK
jgi:hypothetical protein